MREQGDVSHIVLSMDGYWIDTVLYWCASDKLRRRGSASLSKQKKAVVGRTPASLCFQDPWPRGEPFSLRAKARAPRRPRAAIWRAQFLDPQKCPEIPQIRIKAYNFCAGDAEVPLSLCAREAHAGQESLNEAAWASDEVHLSLPEPAISRNSSTQACAGSGQLRLARCSSLKAWSHHQGRYRKHLAGLAISEGEFASLAPPLLRSSQQQPQLGAASRGFRCLL